ncbi:MAG: hypothetical protein ACTSU8_04905 [Alphaproteobacteria bacterium]
MDIYTMVVAIVAIAMAAGVINHYLKTRHKKADPAEMKDIHHRLDRLEKIEKRVTVLEKIVTNKKVNLADEINSL